MSPFSLIEAASSASAWGSKRLRGWSGSRMTDAIERLVMAAPDFRHVEAERGLEPLAYHVSVTVRDAFGNVLRTLVAKQHGLGAGGEFLDLLDHDHRVERRALGEVED